MDVLAFFGLWSNWTSLISTCLLLYFLCYFVSFQMSPLKNIPGPMPLPIIGNTLDLIREPNEHKLYVKWTKKYGKIFKYKIPIVGQIVYISDLQVAKQILVTDAIIYDRADIVRKLIPDIKDGVFSVGAKENGRQRKLLNSHFSLSSVKSYFEMFNVKTAILVKHFKDKLQTSEATCIQESILTYMKYLTLETTCKFALDYDFDFITGKGGEETEALEMIVGGDFDFTSMALDVFFPIFKWLPLKSRNKMNKARHVIKEMIKKIVAKRLTEMTVNGTFFKVDVLQTILDMYKNEHGSVRDNHIYGQVLTIMIAGQETTALTLSWTLYMLAKNPEKQDRARKEVYGVFEGHENISWDKLDLLKYTDCCLKEALRLFPPGIYIYRIPRKDTKIGPYNIPKDTQLLIGLGSRHMDPLLWDQENMFLPERFEDEEKRDPSFLYSYLPFSRGPRTCIGRKFAEVEMKVVLSTLLKNFKFTVPDNHPFVDGRVRLVLQPFPPPVLEISMV